MSALALGLDLGGTFTDVVMIDPSSGVMWTAKTPSTPGNPALGFFDGFDKALGLASRTGKDVAAVFHGSTVATNAILEDKGARTGMLVTAGFKYVLEIGRHQIPRKEHLYAWVKPKRPVPPRLIFEVPERVLLDGSVDQAIDEDACRQAVRRLRSLGVEAVAIVFLHSYANPAHERRAAEIVHEEFAQAEVSLSSEVLPIFREYERSMTTVLNAYVQPLVGRYVRELAGGLKTRSVAAPLFVMKSNGGVFGPAIAARQPVNMALSGPAAGAIGAGFVARSSGFLDAIIIDIGGTSADVSLIRGGAPQMTNDGEIGGFPLALPIVDIHTIGAGGGSVARVVTGGGIAVGPQSAGAAPGPACYGHGGTLPTVTDANLVLGRLPVRLLDGAMAIDPELAARAIHDHIAGPLGIDVVKAAQGILRIVDNNMVGALKVVSVEKGYDPRDFALVAFGGAGPAHAGSLARELGTRTIVIPPHPGLLCALGLLASDLAYDYARTFPQRAPEQVAARIESTFAQLEAQAVADLAREGIPAARQRLQRLADLRYHKQGFELTVPVPAGRFDPQAARAMVEAFHRLHQQLYTFADRNAGVELVTLRLRAVGVMDKIAPREIAAVAEGTPAQASAARSVWFDGHGFVETPVYRRADLRAGHRIDGPAIVDQLDTTTVILPADRAGVDRYGNIVITLA